MGAVSIAFVTEALGTKNLVADAVRAYTGRTHYDAIARDTVATILNDLCSVGARPAALTAYWGAGDGAWFSDAERARDLTEGWAAACEECRVSWGGGETQVLPSLIEAGKRRARRLRHRHDPPSENTLHGERLEAGDQILIAPASGIHANGLSLARKIAAGLPAGLPNPHQRRPHLRRSPARSHPAVRAAGRKPANRRRSAALRRAHHRPRLAQDHARQPRADLRRCSKIPPVPPVLSFLAAARRALDAKKRTAP